tara:strand:+ start:14524 stop:14742 length:219 start_codon:yes stop_codon:yes gene_type:complete
LDEKFGANEQVVLSELSDSRIYGMRFSAQAALQEHEYGSDSNEWKERSSGHVAVRGRSQEILCISLRESRRK